MDDTEEALIRAACENWSERDVKLRLADYLAELGQQERAELVVALNEYEWKPEPDPLVPSQTRHLLTNGTIVLALISAHEGTGKQMLVWEDEKRFYTGEAGSLEEGQFTIQEFFLSGKGHFTDAAGLERLGRLP